MQSAFEFFGCGSVDLPPVHLEEMNYFLLRKKKEEDLLKLYQSIGQHITLEDANNRLSFLQLSL